MSKRARSGSYSQSGPWSSQASVVYGADNGPSQNYNQASNRFYRTAKAPKFKGKGAKNIAKIARSVANNVVAKKEEVKVFYYGGASQSVAQTYTTPGPVTTAGYWGSSLAFPTTGTGRFDMIGSEIRLQKLNIAFQFNGQVNCSNTMRLKFFFVKVKDNTSTLSAPSIWAPNYAIDVANGGTGFGSVVGIYDTNSMRNLVYSDTIAWIKEYDICIEPTDSGTGSGTKVLTSSVQFEIPLNDVKCKVYLTDSISQQYQMFLLADVGNRGTTAGALTQIPIQTASSGLAFTYNTSLFFTDA